MKKLSFIIKSLCAFGLLTSAAMADELKIECAPTAVSREYCGQIKERFEKETGHTLKFLDLPLASDEKLSLLQQLFATKDSGAVDLFLADTVWIGVLNHHLLDMTDHVKDREAEFFPSAWQNNIVDGRVMAIPAFLDTGVMYYRTDLLEKYGEKVPTTYADMARIAEKVQAGERAAGNPRFWGYLFQGKSYEGLACNALEWISSNAGGQIVEPDGTVTINNQHAADALDMAAKWVGTISPRGTLGYMEEESRAIFHNGDGLFLRNWLYVYLLTQDPTSPIRGKVGIMQVPAGEHGKPTNTLGGWQWAISKYTKNPEAALKLLDIASDIKSQKMQLMKLGNPPSRLALYEDPEVLTALPWIGQLKSLFDNAVPRPATQTRRQYAQVSRAIYNTSYNVLSGRTDGQTAVRELQARLDRVKGREWR